MSTGTTNPTEIEVLAERANSLHQNTQQLMGALSQVRRTRFILLLALVVFAAVTCFAFYRLVAKFQEKEQLDLLLSKAQQRLTERNDLIMKDVQALVDHSAPVVSKAFYEQAKNDLPAFLQAGQSERDKLVENLQERLTERLKRHHQNLLARHEKLLREEFPAVKDEKLHVAMMANLQIVVDELVKKYYIEELQSEMKSLYATWDEFPAADPADKGDLPLEDQLVANLLELLKIKLAETGSTDPNAVPPVAPAAAKPTEKPTEKPVEKPAEKPAEKAAEKPAAAPADNEPAAAE